MLRNVVKVDFEGELWGMHSSEEGGLSTMGPVDMIRLGSDSQKKSRAMAADVVALAIEPAMTGEDKRITDNVRVFLAQFRCTTRELLVCAHGALLRNDRPLLWLF